MNARTGKIARLSKAIREELNRRLENGERAPAILKWLNELPEIQKLITEQFGGHLIRAQNLSQWRQGGYLDWTRHQLLREQARFTAEQAAELGLDTTGKSISIAEDIATVISAELTIHVRALSAIKNPKQRFRQFRLISRELSRLRRDDQRAIRNQLRRKQSQSTLEPVAENSGTGAPPLSPTLGAPASRRPDAINPDPPKLENSPVQTKRWWGERPRGPRSNRSRGPRTDRNRPPAGVQKLKRAPGRSAQFQPSRHARQRPGLR